MTYTSTPQRRLGEADHQATVAERVAALDATILTAFTEGRDYSIAPYVRGGTPWTTTEILLQGGLAATQRLFLAAVSAALHRHDATAAALLRKAARLSAVEFAREAA